MMTSLDKIGVRAENVSDHGTGNVLPILHEIRHALSTLADSGSSTVIDLAAIPFAPGDKNRLLDTLGKGEVDAVVRALGESRVRESGYPGVWLVEHFAADGSELGTLIEISRTPSLLATPAGDIADSITRLAAVLGAAPAAGEAPHLKHHPAQE